MIKVTKFGLTLVAMAAAIGSACTNAAAAEPRPWLCRDKPVFSSPQPMTYSATNRRGGRWILTFMRYDPEGGHDGFTIYSTRDVNGTADGTLEPGQWFAVGLYRESGHWICAARAGEKHQFVPGVVRDLCYGQSEGACEVKMIVREAGGPAQAPAH